MNVPKELVLQWYSLSKDSYEFAQRAAAHGAAQRDAELMRVGMDPVALATADRDGYDPRDGHKQFIGLSIHEPFVFGGSTAMPLYTAEQLAAARLQGTDALSEQYAKLAQHCTMLEGKLAQCEKPIGVPDLDAQLMEQNTAIDAACARLERVNQALLEALQTLVSAHGSILELSESPALKNARAAIAAAEQEAGK